MTAYLEALGGRRADPAVVEAVAGSMEQLPRRYLPARAAHTPRRYLIRVAGCPPYTVFTDGPRCVVRQIAAADAHAELRTDAASWLDIVTGHRDGLECFFLGLLQVHGDLNEALRLETLFAPPADSPGALSHARIVRHPFGRRLSIETFEAGPPDAPAVLFLHGLGASKVSLLPAIAGLARRWRVVAMDFPGFGKSSAPMGARYDAAWMARSALAALDAAGIDRAAVVGNSMGGRVAVELALAHPDRVAALGLLCPAVAFDEYRLVRPLLSMLRVDLYGAVPWPLDGALPRRALDIGLRALFADASRVPAANLAAAREDALRSLRSRRRRLALLAATRRIGLDAPRRFWARLDALSVPSLWIFGDRDRLVSRSYAHNVRLRVPSAVVEVWHDCGHVPQFEYPVETVDRLDAFFADAVGRVSTLRPSGREGAGHGG